MQVDLLTWTIHIQVEDVTDEYPLYGSHIEVYRAYFR
jgi:hypothetical protein